MFKLSPILIILSTTTVFSFLLTYFLDLTATNTEQYMAVISVMFLDGVFGMIAGSKREGFQTRKALKVIRNTFVWISILTVILIMERGIQGTSWLSEVILAPFMTFQIISILKNASMAGYIKASVLNEILDRIDKHKGDRQV
jgi:phage-related holin